jgi:hypothetical protein
VARHVVARVEKARRFDPKLTIRQAAKELGISESSYYKMRSGTRTGSKVRKQLWAPKEDSRGRKGSVRNVFNVKYESPDGRVASRNVWVEEGGSKADVLLMKRDPRVRRGLQKQMEAENRRPQPYGASAKWTRRQIRGMRITSVDKVVMTSADARPWVEVHLTR